MATKYIIKYMDELGNLYSEIEIPKNVRERNRLIREFINGNTYGRFDVGDVLVIAKSTGGELWIFAE